MPDDPPHPSPPRPPPPSPPTVAPDPTANLDEVVDDLGPKEECADWILAQMTAGRPAEDLTAELIDQGWNPDDAESLVEYVRRATRHERGVVTREDVARTAVRRYRQSWSLTWFAGFPAIASGVRLVGALRNLLGFRRVTKGTPPSGEENRPFE